MPDWFTAIAPAVVAAAAGIGGVYIGHRQQRWKSQEEAQRAEEARTRALVDRYQEPLLRAAFDLQSRLYNILDEGLLSRRYEDADPGYGVNSTAWLFGQYFGWVEIVRREAQFLPHGDERTNLQSELLKISAVCASDKLDPAFRIFRADQRALGEIMIVDGKDGEGRARSDCLGYAAFVACLEKDDSPIGPWFARLRANVQDLMNNPRRPPRLEKLQHALIDFIDEADPKQGDPRKQRFEKDRSKAHDRSAPTSEEHAGLP